MRFNIWTNITHIRWPLLSAPNSFVVRRSVFSPPCATAGTPLLIFLIKASTKRSERRDGGSRNRMRSTCILASYPPKCGISCVAKRKLNGRNSGRSWRKKERTIPPKRIINQLILTERWETYKNRHGKYRRMVPLFCVPNSVRCPA